jgi:hypothetical protein
MTVFTTEWWIVTGISKKFLASMFRELCSYLYVIIALHSKWGTKIFRKVRNCLPVLYPRKLATSLERLWQTQISFSESLYNRIYHSQTNDENAWKQWLRFSRKSSLFYWLWHIWHLLAVCGFLRIVPGNNSTEQSIDYWDGVVWNEQIYLDVSFEDFASTRSQTDRTFERTCPHKRLFLTS